MEKLFDLLDLMKTRINELEEMLDDLEVEKNELSLLRDKDEIKEVVDYWLKNDFIELQVLINEVAKWKYQKNIKIKYQVLK